MADRKHGAGLCSGSSILRTLASERSGKILSKFNTMMFIRMLVIKGIVQSYGIGTT